MPVKKYANASVTCPDMDQRHWADLHGSRSSRGTSKFASDAVDTSKYLLSHVTILASVQCESGHEDWLIKPESSHLVNNNDDAFENTVIKLAYKTFRGAFNFVEHYQNSKASKGYIVDAVLRKIQLTDDCWVYYCDLLVATDLKHTQLVADIKSGKIKYLSMGCVTDLITCSYCGASNDGIGVACGHLANAKGRFLNDRDGIPRRVAELCGHRSMPGGGVKFVEASWVKTPAFPGAANRGIIADSWEAPGFTKSASGIYVPSQKVASGIKHELPTTVSGRAGASSAELRRLRS